MMPIFFHAQSHIWIFLALFLNGFFVHAAAFSFSKQYREITKSIEAQIIMSFVFSLSINGLTLLTLDVLNLPFSNAKYVLATVACLAGFIGLKNGFLKSWSADLNIAAIFLYAIMFVILFYNGGLIDQISDAWWHMSLANKIGLANSFSLEYGHLTGEPTRYYPPLWHGNLALLKELSGQSVPSIFNAYTAWGGVLKLMSVYVLSTALFNDKRVGFVAALLFALLPGLGNSYMRVSAWPSHQSYILLFFSLYLSHHIIERVIVLRGAVANQIKELLQKPVDVLILLLALLLMFFLHQLEVLLFFIAIFMYLAGLSQSKLLFGEGADEICLQIPSILRGIYRFGLITLIFVVVYKGIDWRGNMNGVDELLVSLFPLALFATLLVSDLNFFAGKKWSRLVPIFLCLILVSSLSLRQISSLFIPELAWPISGAHEKPVVAIGWFGGELAAPGWHLQLRYGLIWSGLVGFVLSLFLLFIKRDRAMVFLVFNSLVVWVMCCSPYFYQWFSKTLAYHSSWRIAILSFHPIVIAAIWMMLFDGAFGRYSSTKVLRALLMKKENLHE